MIKLPKWLRVRLEVYYIRKASKILMDRNLVRSLVVSRRDNNDMWYMAERLDAICVRMLDGYNHI